MVDTVSSYSIFSFMIAMRRTNRLTHIREYDLSLKKIDVQRSKIRSNLRTFELETSNVLQRRRK